MKQLVCTVFAFALAVGVAGCASSGASGVPAVEAAEIPLWERADTQWWRDSMKTRDARLAWFEAARFGMFIHWGAYSHVGGVWQGQPVPGYAEHVMRKMKIPSDQYLEQLVKPFHPTKFDADTWVRHLKDAGMRYLIITSKHHDGFAMFDSDVSDYNIVKASTWKHDPMKDLKEACDKNGIKFGFYYSQAWEWHHPDAPGNDWEYENPGGNRALYGKQWWVGNSALVERVRRYVDGKVIPQIKELVAKYDPDIIWFDTPSRLPPEENLRVLKALREAKPSIVVNGRAVQSLPGGPAARFGDYLSTTDKPAEFPPHEGVWEAIPTTNESYGWHRMDTSHKPASHFVELLAKAAARGGNTLLNIGPRGDGTFDPKDVAILEGVGKWMKLNAAAIHGTQRTPLPVQAWGESTRKGNTLFLHALQWPQNGKIVVGGLKSKIVRAYVLADPNKKSLKTERLGEVDWSIAGPTQAPDAVDTVIAVEVDGEMAVDATRLVGTEVKRDVLRAFDAQISGDLEFGRGKMSDAYVLGWTGLDDAVRWALRLRAPATFQVDISYDAEADSAGGKFEVTVGDQKLTGAVDKTPEAPVSLGQVSLPAGPFEIQVKGTELKGEELFRLRAVRLTPVSPVAKAR